MQVIRFRSHGRWRKKQLRGIGKAGIGAPRRRLCATPGDEGTSNDDAQRRIARGTTDRRHCPSQGGGMNIAGQGKAQDIVPTGRKVRDECRQGIGGRSADDRGRPARIATKSGRAVETERMSIPRCCREKDATRGLMDVVPGLRSDRIPQKGLEASHRLRDREEVTQIPVPQLTEIPRYRRQHLFGQDVPRDTANRLPGDFHLKPIRVVEQSLRQFANIPRGGLDGHAIDAAEAREDLLLDNA